MTRCRVQLASDMVGWGGGGRRGGEGGGWGVRSGRPVPVGLSCFIYLRQASCRTLSHIAVSHDLTPVSHFGATVRQDAHPCFIFYEK